MNDIKDELAFFAGRMRYYRKKSGMTQAQLSEKIDVSEHYVRLIENGYSIPSAELFCRICQALEVPAYSLLQSEQDSLRFENPKLYEKLSSMSEEQLNSVLNILFK